MKGVIYFSRGFRFGSLEFPFIDEDAAHAISVTPIGTEKRVFYQAYMNRNIVEVRFGNKAKMADSSCAG